MPQQPFPVLGTKEAAPSQEPEVVQIRWNNDDRATLPAHRPKQVTRFYAAARKWVDILRRPESEYWVQLTPGKVLSK